MSFIPRDDLPRESSHHHLIPQSEKPFYQLTVFSVADRPQRARLQPETTQLLYISPFSIPLNYPSRKFPCFPLFPYSDKSLSSVVASLILADNFLPSDFFILENSLKVCSSPDFSCPNFFFLGGETLSLGQLAFLNVSAESSPAFRWFA